MTDEQQGAEVPRAKIQVFRSEEDSQFYFRVKAVNGEIVAQSEGYETEEGAREGVNAMIEAVHLGEANIEVEGEPVPTHAEEPSE